MMVNVISDSWAAIIGIFGIIFSTACFVSYHIGKAHGRKQQIPNEVKHE